MLNLTPLTPPRVPLIDPRTGLIERSWYMFFLSVFQTMQGTEDLLLAPNAASLLASYDEALQALAMDIKTAPAWEGAREEVIKTAPAWEERRIPDSLSPAQPFYLVEDVSPLFYDNRMPDNNGTVASAATINLTSITSSTLDVTGTTTVTALQIPEGQTRLLRFTGALILTNGAFLALPGGANITTAAGDFAEFRGYASSVVRCVIYSPNSTVAAGTAAEIAAATHGVASKTTPVDADELPLVDSAAAFALKRLTWANLKATLATWINGGTIAAYFTQLRATSGAFTTWLDISATSANATRLSFLSGFGGKQGITFGNAGSGSYNSMAIVTAAGSAPTLTIMSVAGLAPNADLTTGYTPLATFTYGAGLAIRTVRATAAAGFISSDGSAGYTGTVTTASLVGKTITIKDGLVTGFA